MQMIYKANSCFDSNEIGCQQSDSRALQFQITMKETSTYKVIEMFLFLTRIELSHSDKSMFSHQTTTSITCSDHFYFNGRFSGQ